MTSRARWFRAAYILTWLVALSGIAAELLLVLKRRDTPDEESYTARNVFDRSRAMNEGRDASLWEIPEEKYRSGARLTLQVDGQPYEIVINRHGFRDRDVSLQKPAGVFRAVCIGGSTTVQGHTNAQTYPALLQKLLDPLPDGRRVEVLNLGINGTGSDFWLRSRERTERLFSFEPDLVIQYAFVNDFFWKHVPWYARQHPLRRTAYRSLLLARLWPLPAEAFDSRFQGTLSRFRQIAEEARTRGAGYLAVPFVGPDPTLADESFRRYLDRNTEQWGHPLRLRYYDDYYRVLTRYREFFDAFARKPDIDTVVLPARTHDPSLFTDLCHMTPEGIAELAAGIAPAVRRIAAESGG
jgi:lysophospholipase L1-like esterase